MFFDKYDVINEENVLKEILELSHRVSNYSIPMKPFIRFSKQTEGLYKNHPEIKNTIWDFDYVLQKALLSMALTISTPEQLSQACIERWKENLNNLYIGKQKLLNEVINGTKSYQFQYSHRSKFILERIKPQSRFLYLGCGSGKECIDFANEGHKVVGIDTDFKLLEIANKFSAHLSLPFYVVCMDAINLGFAKWSFDSFLLEFYGNQTSLTEIIKLQESLANILNDDGIGFIVSSRKKYTSYWYLMGTRYPKPMTNWLGGQSIFDFYYSQPDECQETLMYGLYSRSHTVDSLKTELQYGFNVLECNYSENDPRYVLCLVKRKDKHDLVYQPDQYFKYWESRNRNLNLSGQLIHEIISNISLICDFLKSHEESVSQYFNENEFSDKRNPLGCVQSKVLEFVELLMNTFNMVSANSQ